MNLIRSIDFLKRYILKHPLYVVTYICTYFLKDFVFNVHFFSKEEMIDHLRKGKSIIRLGDGEINLLLDLKNHYHSFSPRLKMMMKEIIKSYSQNSPYILAIPRFVNVTNNHLHTIGKHNVWLPFKVIFFLMFSKKDFYMDAHNFYYDNYFEGTVAPLFKNKKVIFVTRKETIEKQRNNPHLPWKDALYIETPATDAMDAYEDIKKELGTALIDSVPKEVVLFFAMGPVGKYMLYEYALKGYQGIDIGKVVEVMFTGESIEFLI